MNLIERLPAWIGLALLATGAICGGIAWQLQSAAAADLERAVEVQESEVPESSSAPPELSQYRRILETLDKSIEIRREIDESIAVIEGIVSDLSQQQSEAADIFAAGREEIVTISGTLGRAAQAGRATSADLKDLDGKLFVSADLSCAIARELEELDESLGPSASGGLRELIEDITGRQP